MILSVAFRKLLRSLALGAVGAIVICVILVGASESRLLDAGLAGDRMASLAEGIGYVGLKLSSAAVVICSVVLGFGATARECLSYAIRWGVLLGLDLLILTILGLSVHSWTMVLIFPAIGFAASAVVLLIAAAVHAVADRQR
jgi:hypothetical protein